MRPIEFIKTIVPVIGVLASYSIPYFGKDLLASLTMVPVIIPQSMAYALIAGMPPVYGLYTSIIPTIFYALFATSRHLSVGTFALISLLISASVRSIIDQTGIDSGSKQLDSEQQQQQLIIVITLLLTFCVGISKVILSFLRIGGFVSNHFLPDCLVSGLTTASALHIGTAQVPTLLGISIKKSYGAFSLFYQWSRIFSSLNRTHLPTFFLGLATFIVAKLFKLFADFIVARYSNNNHRSTMTEPLLGDDNVGSDTTVVTTITSTASSHQSDSPDAYLAQSLPEQQQQRRKKCHTCYIPHILLSVVLMTVVGFIYNQNASTNSQIRIIETIPNGFPTPNIPFSSDKLCSATAANTNNETIPTPDRPCNEVFQSVLLATVYPALKIALVSATLSFASIELFARKEKYSDQIRLDQELFALGIANVLGPILGQSFVASGSLSRTALAAKSGAATTMAGLYAALIVLVIIVSPLTEILRYIPMTVLSGVVFMAVENLLFQLGEGVNLLKMIRTKSTVEERKRPFHIVEAIIWWLTFATVIVLDVDIGILAGFVVCALLYLYQYVIPRMERLSFYRAREKYASPLQNLNDASLVTVTSTPIEENMDDLVRNNPFVIVARPFYALYRFPDLLFTSTIPPTMRSSTFSEDSELKVGEQLENEMVVSLYRPSGLLLTLIFQSLRLLTLKQMIMALPDVKNNQRKVLIIDLTLISSRISTWSQNHWEQLETFRESVNSERQFKLAYVRDSQTIYEVYQQMLSTDWRT